MTLHSLDHVVDSIIGPEFITRRTLMEHLRPGRKYAGCAHKIGNRWAFTDDDITRLLDRMRGNDIQDLDPPPPTRLPSGISPRSPRARRPA